MKKLFLCLLCFVNISAFAYDFGTSGSEVAGYGARYGDGNGYRNRRPDYNQGTYKIPTYTNKGGITTDVPGNIRPLDAYSRGYEEAGRNLQYSLLQMAEIYECNETERGYYTKRDSKYPRFVYVLKSRLNRIFSKN